MIAQTKRLYIRPIKLDDASSLLAIFGYKEVMRFSRAGVKTLEQIKESLTNFYLKSYETNGFGMYAVIQKTDNQLVGICGFFTEEIDGQEYVELAYRLATNYWGMGFATEAALTLKDYARDKLKIKTLISIIAVKNTASIRVAEKIGMSLWKKTVMYSTEVVIYKISA